MRPCRFPAKTARAPRGTAAGRLFKAALPGFDGSAGEAGAISCSKGAAGRGAGPAFSPPASIASKAASVPGIWVPKEGTNKYLRMMKISAMVIMPIRFSTGVVCSTTSWREGKKQHFNGRAGVCFASILINSTPMMRLKACSSTAVNAWEAFSATNRPNISPVTRTPVMRMAASTSTAMIISSTLAACAT